MFIFGFVWWDIFFYVVGVGWPDLVCFGLMMMCLPFQVILDFGVGSA